MGAVFTDTRVAVSPSLGIITDLSGATHDLAITVYLARVVDQPKVWALPIGILAGILVVMKLHRFDFSKPFWFEASWNFQVGKLKQVTSPSFPSSS